MDMVERVGRAIAEAENYAYDPVPYDRYARAAIEAMKEPTAAMVEAGVTADHGKTLGERATNCHTAMIDAALSPSRDKQERI